MYRYPKHILIPCKIGYNDTMNPHTHQRSNLRLPMDKYLLQHNCERVAQGNAEVAAIRGANL